MKKRNVRTLALIVTVFTYLLIGAAVFDALEGPHNENAFEALNEVKSDIMSRYNMTEEDYKLMEVLIIERKPHRNGPQWKFAGSFYYALVVLTLIGYGHSTPNTVFGKTFTMGYACVGIPCAMVMFQCMGERMNYAFSVIIGKIKKVCGCSRTDVTEVELILSSVGFSGFVVSCGALLYHTKEGWSLFDAQYYTFITLSTIGFGDFVALQNNKALQFEPGYVACSFIFLLLGLASLSSSINLLVLRFMILSLEDEEDQEELQDAAQNVVTLDGEVMAVNGRVLSGHNDMNHKFKTGLEPDAASVCSCTCYGTSGSSGYAKQENPGLAIYWRAWRRLTRLFGCQDFIGSPGEESNFYDAENQSISNHARLAVKRASF